MLIYRWEDGTHERTHSTAASSDSSSSALPRLEPGDVLTREEFERRYAAMPNLKKAELIGGVVFMPAAVRFGHHASPHARLIYWLCAYQKETPNVIVGDNVACVWI